MRTSLPRLTEDTQRQLAQLGVVLCYAHGSVIAGRAMRESDLDIAVLLDASPNAKDALVLMEHIRKILQHLAPKRELDISFLNEAGPLFQQVVAAGGELLYARSDDDRIRFEFHAMHEYEASKRVRRIGYDLLNTHYASL